MPLHFNQFKNFFKLLIYSYTYWYGMSGLIYCLTPLGVTPALLVMLSIYCLRIPQPDKAQVEQIIGKDYGEDSNSNNVVMKTVAHRGAGLDAPENSLIAFKKCAEKGCNFIEFDITLTKDGVPIVFHDETLERIAEDKRVIADCEWKDLKNVDISVTHSLSDRFRGTNIPTLDETVKQMLQDQQRMFIDIKDNNMKMIKVVLDLFKQYPELHKKAIVTTFYPHLIYMIRRKNRNIVCSMAYRPHYFSHKSYSHETGPGPRRANSWWWHYCLTLLNSLHAWCLPRFTYYLLGLSMILMHKECVSGEEIEKWRKKSVRVAVWTVNLPMEKQYFSRSMKISYLTDTLVGESTLNLVK